MPYSKIFIILLFEFGFAFKFNIIGTISISELFLFVYVPLFIFPKVKWGETNDFKKISIIYILLLCFQILSEIIIGNDWQNALKGLAITIVSYLHFIFLVFYLSQQKSLILILLISQILRVVMSGSVVEEQSVEDLLEGEASAYLKFYIAPLITWIFLAISVIYKYKNFSVLFSILGVVFIVLGARSSGGIALSAGIITYILEHRLFVYNKKVIALSMFLVCIIGYIFYAYYVNQVLAGKITSGNNQQLFLCNNPYNPLELLMAGRSEAWVGWQAFMDKFWFGHGAWPYDSTGKYQRLMLAMHNELATVSKNQISFHYLIPSHSVLIGSGMMNGIFAFLTMAYIVIFFLWKGLCSFIECENKYKLILVYLVLDLSWTALFSPQSHFRLTMPINFAIIFIMYLSIKNKHVSASFIKRRFIEKNNNYGHKENNI